MDPVIQAWLPLRKMILYYWYKYTLFIILASEEDSKGIFNLSNDDLVRNNSFSPDKIKWRNHQKWFQQKLSSENCEYFIVKSMNKLLGQIRFDIDKIHKEAVINFSFAKQIRGLNLSSDIVNRSIEKIIKLHSNLKIIKAYILGNNIPSIKCFERAGFCYKNLIVIKEKKAKVYIRYV